MSYNQDYVAGGPGNNGNKQESQTDLKKLEN